MLVPKLRFPGFEDEWQVVKLGDIAHFSKGAGVSKSDIDLSGSREAIRYGELYTIYGEVVGDVHSKIIPSERDVLSEDNDVLIPSSGETAINISTATYVGKNGVAVGGDLNIIRTNESGRFLSYLLNHGKKLDVARLAQGVSVVHLYASELKGLQIEVPAKEEQEKIADFLMAVDERIELQSHKVEKLETYKRGIVQKIFSQQLRFRKSDNTKFSDWESVRLRDVLNCGSKTPVINTDEYNKLTVGLNKAGVRPAKIDRKMSDTRPFYVRSKNELIVGKQNYFSGSIAVIPDELDGAIASNAIMSFTPKRGNVKFIYEYISQNNYINKRNALANGTGQKELSENDFLNFDIGIPTEEEQQKIAAFLSQIDEKITLETEKLEGLKKFRKSLLQRMFV